MPAFREKPRPEHVKMALDILAFWVDLFAIAIIAAVIFSFPFPFVRQVWIKEATGLTGLINSVFLIVIARAMKRLEFSAPLAGLGLILNEVVIVWRSYNYLALHGSPSRYQIYFLCVSIFANFLMALLFMIAFKRLYRLYATGFEKSHKEIIKVAPMPAFMTFVLNSAAYLMVVAGVYIGHFFHGGLRFSMYEFLGEVSALIAAIGIGHEIKACLNGGQAWPQGIIKSLSHFLALAVIFLVLYKAISFEGVIATF